VHAVEFETRRQVIEGHSDRLCRVDGLRLHGQQDACHGEQRRNQACEPDHARGNECRAHAECATRRHGSAYLVRVYSPVIGEADTTMDVAPKWARGNESFHRRSP